MLISPRMNRSDWSKVVLSLAVLVGWSACGDETDVPTPPKVPAASSSTTARRPSGEVTLQVPADHGSWAVGSSSSFPNLDTLAVHAALMPPKSSAYAARIVVFGGSQNEGTKTLWASQRDPWRLIHSTSGTFTTLSPNLASDVFCAGHGHTPNGDLLVVSGNEYYEGRTPNPAHRNSFTGTRTTYQYNFATETVTTGQLLQKGRWYPTIVRGLPNAPFPNQLVALSGLTDFAYPEAEFLNDTIEAFNGTSLPWDSKGYLAAPLYPHAFLVPWQGGRIVVASTFENGMTRALLATDGHGFQRVDVTPQPTPIQYAQGGAGAVLLPLRPNSVGTYPPGKLLVTNFAPPRVLDLANPSLGWQDASAGEIVFDALSARKHANATILATGDVVVTGGVLPQDANGDGVLETIQDGHNGTANYSRYEAHIYRDDTKRWVRGPSATVSRNYHSVALLLPDGRVWTAGGNKHGGSSNPDGSGRELRQELFRPWYFSRTDRPSIGSVGNPSSRTADWTIPTSQGGGITRVALIAPGSVTHAFDSDQRYVGLRILRQSSGQSVTVRIPSDASVLPKGHYMLVISRSVSHAAGQHLPSIAKWVKIP